MSIQIPNLHTSNKTKAVVKAAKVFIGCRKDALHTGTFTVRGQLTFDPATDAYPGGSLVILVDLSDSAKGAFNIKTVEQLDTTGKHSPTVYATGRCSADSDQKARGLRYWLMLVDNNYKVVPESPDVISFLIYDNVGKRVAYGTGPVMSGDLKILSVPGQ